MKKAISVFTSGFLMTCCLTVLAGCSDSAINNQSASKSNWEPLVNLNPIQHEQKMQAFDARDRLFGSLMSDLMSSMTENGPAKSIKVCKSRAPAIAAEIGNETGVRIGRTSFKLRNHGNMAPEWAFQFVEQRVENEIVVKLLNNRLGVLLPIRLKATCIMCHGDDNQVLPDVKAAIVSNYPDDQATGFAEGDLRGYFWVEVPGEGKAK